VPRGAGNAMQKGYKYDLFVKGANGVGFAYVEH
jgi:hypothetical protein